jgi:large subunit ribosomal protein L4
MVNIPAYNLEGAQAGEVALDEKLLGEVRKPLMRQAVKTYEDRRRIGSHCMKGRGEIAGSGKKMYKQKHTGMARMGQKRVPHRRGGGVTFALKNFTIHADTPRKALRQAMLSAVLARLQDNVIRVVEEPQLTEPKTRVIAELLKKIDVAGSCLIITGENQSMIWKSARNLAGVDICRVQDLNAYVLLKREHVLFTRSAMDRFLEGLAK